MSKFEKTKEKIKEYNYILDTEQRCLHLIHDCLMPYDPLSPYSWASIEHVFGSDLWNRIRRDIKVILQKELVILQAESLKLSSDVVNL